MIPELGIDNGELTQCPKKPNCVSSQANDEKHYIEPIVITGTTANIKEHLLTVLNAQAGSTVIMADDNYVRATFTSKIFRFVDDVEFYFPDTVSTAAEITVHMRSASRVGYSDLGVNRRRLERIRSQLRALI